MLEGAPDEGMREVYQALHSDFVDSLGEATVADPLAVCGAPCDFLIEVYEQMEANEADPVTWRQISRRSYVHLQTIGALAFLDAANSKGLPVHIKPKKPVPKQVEKGKGKPGNWN